MIATCQICRQVVKPGPIVIGQPPAHPVQQLCEAIGAHMAQYHRAEMSHAVMAGLNAQSLVMLQSVACTDPKFLEVIAQSCGGLASLLEHWSRILDADSAAKPETENALQ